MWLPVAGASIALCESCHGPNGNSTTAGTPSIAAQPVTFLENQLVYFREELRPAPVMQGVAKTLKDADISAVAKHFHAQKAQGPAGSPDAALMAKGKELADRM